MLTKQTTSDPLEYDRQMNALRMYVLVRRDILPLQHCVPQASHAVAEYVHYNRDHITKQWVESDKTIVILQVTEKQLNDKLQDLDSRGFIYEEFCEPDMSNVVTAVAIQPMSKRQGIFEFSDIPLLK